MRERWSRLRRFGTKVRPGSAVAIEPHAAHQSEGIFRLRLSPDLLTRSEVKVSVDGATVDAKTSSHNPYLYVVAHGLEPGSHELVIEAPGAKASPVPLEISTPAGGVQWRSSQHLADINTRIHEQHLDWSQFRAMSDHEVPWFDRPDAIDRAARMRDAGAINPDDYSHLVSLITEGFTIIRGAVDASELRRVRAEMDHMASTRYQGYVWGTSQRLEHTHWSYPGIAAVSDLPAVRSLLAKWYQAPAHMCQTLVYIFGSQQGSHQDTVHLTSFPAGYMNGVWLAVDDVVEGSGELFYYPGSHRAPRIYMSDVGATKVTADEDWKGFAQLLNPRWESIAQAGYERVPFLCEAGDVLIWHENLLHGGAPRVTQDQSRRSVVTHYFAQGVVAFYDSSGQAARFAADGQGPAH